MASTPPANIDQSLFWPIDDLPFYASNSFESNRIRTAGDNRHGRFPRSAKLILQRWYTSHSKHPYPTEGEKLLLEQQSGLDIRQISKWFVNARRRAPLRALREKADAGIQAQKHKGSIMEDMSPLERWRSSPPDEEPASWEAITQAVESTSSTGSRISTSALPLPPTHACHQAFSDTSLNSSDFAWTSGSSESMGSLVSTSSCAARLSTELSTCSRSGHRQVTSKHVYGISKTHRPGKDRKYQCTFCTDTFKSKYDWTRHESTLHLRLESWTCCPHGATYVDKSSEIVRCIFCDEAHPTEVHTQSHMYDICSNKPITERTFRRKDHLRQHLRLVHRIDEVRPMMHQWMNKMDTVNCRCGFCGDRFTSWSERNEHISGHYRTGASMKDWTGCRGLDPSVALIVENAMPPYLIGNEINEFEPFSASRMNGNIACPPQHPSSFEYLTLKLREYVERSLRDGLLVTDETVRKQARLIMFGDDDAWNQTPADNIEWLRLFKAGLKIGESTTRQGPTACTDEYLPSLNVTPAWMDANQGSANVAAAGIGGNDAFMGLSMNDLPIVWQTPECLAEFRQMQDTANQTAHSLAVVPNLDQHLPDCDSACQ